MLISKEKRKGKLLHHNINHVKQISCHNTTKKHINMLQSDYILVMGVK
jgi:hypothetical protein